MKTVTIFRRFACLAIASSSLVSRDLSAQTRQGPSPVTLGPGDLLLVRWVGVKEVSDTIIVDERGIAVLPLIGERRVTGSPWEVVRAGLRDAYAQELRQPLMQITPFRRVTVLGHVNRAGVVLVDPQLPLAGAVAMAGGAAFDGDLAHVRVIRDGVVILDGASGDATIVRHPIESGDLIVVGRRGWWDRNSGAMAATLLSTFAFLLSVFR